MLFVGVFLSGCTVRKSGWATGPSASAKPLAAPPSPSPPPPRCKKDQDCGEDNCVLGFRVYPSCDKHEGECYEKRVDCPSDQPYCVRRWLFAYYVRCERCLAGHCAPPDTNPRTCKRREDCRTRPRCENNARTYEICESKRCLKVLEPCGDKTCKEYNVIAVCE